MGVWLLPRCVAVTAKSALHLSDSCYLPLLGVPFAVAFVGEPRACCLRATA